MRPGGMVRVKEIELAKRANGVSQHLRRREESPILVVQGMKLQAVLAAIKLVQPASNPALEIPSMAGHTSKVSPRTLFFALGGAKADGNQFVPDAVARGAAAIASEEPRPPNLPGELAWVQVREARKALAAGAANFYGHPAQALKLVGVTGTNGKTTTTHLVDAILKATGEGTGLFGTIAYHTPRGEYPSPNTTPESLDLQGFIAEIRNAGGKNANLEPRTPRLLLSRLLCLAF